MSATNLHRTMFSRAAMLLVGGSTLQAAVAFAANLVLVRLIAPEGFGRFAVVWGAAGLAFSILSLRINVLIVRCPAAELTERRRRVYATAILAEALLGSAVILAWLAFTGLDSPAELLLVAATAVAHWRNCTLGFFERGLPFARLAAVETGAAVLAHACGIGFALAGFGADALYLREAILTAAGLAGLALAGGLTLCRPAWLRPAEWRGIFREGVGIWLDNVLDGSFQRLVVLVAGALAGLATTGYLFQAMRLATVPHQLVAPLVNRVASVWFGRTEDMAQREAGRRHLLLLAAAGLLPAALLTVAFADPIVPFVFGETWRPAAALLGLLAGQVMFMTLFEIDRNFCLTSRLARGVMPARAAQYAAFLAALAPAAAGWLEPGHALAGALSVSTAAAFLAAESWLAAKRRRDAFQR